MAKECRELINSSLMMHVNKINLPEDCILKNGNFYPSRFMNDIEQDRLALNQLIDDYNKLIGSGTPQRLSLVLESLQKIEDYRKLINNKYPDDVISLSSDFQNEIHDKLFTEIKNQFATLGVSCLHQHHLDLNPQLKKYEDALSPILANASPYKVSIIMRILSGKNPKFNTLFREGDAEFPAFKQFLEAHSIEMLCKDNNSKNFKFTRLDTGESFVLKLENRMKLPKGIESHLRSHLLKDIFTPTLSERQATYFDQKYNKVTRNLVVTLFSQGGNLIDYSLRQVDHKQRLRTAIDIYIQMAEVLVKLVDNRVAFTDMKNTNWLMDSQGKINIADTKGFFPVDKDGKYLLCSEDNIWYGMYDNLLLSAYMSPPEVYVEEVFMFSTDELHSYIFGKNIYQYLTLCKDKYLLHNHDALNDYKFSDQIFKTKQGQELKQLIQCMVTPEVSHRISVKYALLKLTNIRVSLLKEDCHGLLESINLQLADRHYLNTVNFMRFYSRKIDELFNDKQLSSLMDELKEINTDPSLVIKKEDSSKYQEILPRGVIAATSSKEIRSRTSLNLFSLRSSPRMVQITPRTGFMGSSHMNPMCDLQTPRSGKSSSRTDKETPRSSDSTPRDNLSSHGTMIDDTNNKTFNNKAEMEYSSRSSNISSLPRDAFNAVASLMPFFRRRSVTVSETTPLEQQQNSQSAFIA